MIRLGHRFRLVVLLAGIIGASLIIASRFDEWLAPALVSVAFSRYEKHSSEFSTNWAAVFSINNSGSKTVIFRGVGASWEQQLVRVHDPDGWTNSSRPWLSPGAAIFTLVPQQVREVPVFVEKDRSWRVGFRFREQELMDYCPWFLRKFIPNRFWNAHPYQEIWTEPIKARN